MPYPNLNLLKTEIVAFAGALLQRQHERERAAFVCAGGDVEPPAVDFDDLAGDVEPHAAPGDPAATRVRASPETGEDALELSFRDPDSAVGDLDERLATGTPDVDANLTLRVLQRIADDVVDHVTQSSAIEGHDNRHLSGFDRDAIGLGQIAHRVAHELDQILARAA